ncbi:putative maltose porter [Mycena vulgaris]|nr:putative maltose porter [Mycena vulgaris]
MNNGINTQPQAAYEIEAKPSFEKGHIEHEDHTDLKSKVANYKVDAIEAENSEHSMTVMEAVRAYPMACFWALVMSSTIIMESYDVFLMGNFIALPAFTRRFGVATGPDTYVIVTKWQSALQMSGQLGALIGVFIAGPLTSRIGYRWATLLGLALMNATIFVTFFANSLPVFFVGQLLEGLPWGIFIANAPAYCSEIVPLRLRAPATQVLQMFWAIGSIIVGAVTFVYNTRPDENAYKIPIALQWLFPTPLMVLMFFAPESPWWLVRKGRHEQAALSVERLGRKSKLNAGETVAMMRRVVDLEKSTTAPNYLELFKGSDLRRTLIVCGIYAAQNLAGNLIANQAVYFFEQAGMTTNVAFALGLITSALQMIFVMLSWFLTTYFGRRPIYLWGTAFNVVMLVCLGIAASVGPSKAASNAQASFGLIASVMFTFAAAPVSWAIIAETSAIRLRPLTTGIGRASYYIIEIPCIFLGSFMLNPTGGNLGGKCGYVWGGTALATLITAYFCLPEMKGRSYREIDIMFTRHIPARQFEKTVIGAEEDE